MSARLDEHEHRIKALERNIEHMSQSAINTEKNIAESMQIQKHTTHQIREMKQHIERHDTKITELESNYISDSSFKKGLLTGKDNQKKSVNFILGALASLVAVIVGFLTVHEFFRNNEPQHHVQQTIIRGK